jgi:acyl carrier protein phosphodiesterase
MNYLAHATLSFNIPAILVGNMISDYVKGKKQFDYLPEIVTGIQLHRAIDTFTDNHAATQEMKQFFKPAYRLYAGAFCDVVYDHFLANDEAEFATDKILENFAATVYKILDENLIQLPPQVLKMLPYMKTQNWLYNYRTVWGTEKSFAGVVHRSAYLTESQQACEVFNTHYNAMKQLYHQFYPDVKKMATQYLQQN